MTHPQSCAAPVLNHGFTLIEILMVLAISAILLIQATPSIHQMVSRNRMTADLNRIIGAVNLARHSAVTYRQTATLCHLRSTRRCSGQWGEDLTVFLDRNQDARLDDSDTVIATIQQLETGNTVKWRAFQNRGYLQMMPMGYTNYQNGNVTVCPPAGDPRQARQLVINVQGRVRSNHQVNEAGHPVDRKGRLLRC